MPTLGEISLFFNLFPPQKILFCTALVWFLKWLDENWLMITRCRCLALILAIMRLYVVGFCGGVLNNFYSLRLFMIFVEVILCLFFKAGYWKVRMSSNVGISTLYMPLHYTRAVSKGLLFWNVCVIVMYVYIIIMLDLCEQFNEVWMNFFVVLRFCQHNQNGWLDCKSLKQQLCMPLFIWYSAVSVSVLGTVFVEIAGLFFYIS